VIIVRNCTKEYINNAAFYLLIIVVFTLGIIAAFTKPIQPSAIPQIVTEWMRYFVIMGIGLIDALFCYVFVDYTRDYIKYCKGGI
jgi:hypothetical protein